MVKKFLILFLQLLATGLAFMTPYFLLAAVMCFS